MQKLSFAMRVPCTLAVVIVVSQCVLGLAHAQTTEADALISQGVELRRSGDDEGALRVFTQAYELAQTPRALAQMALAEQALGHFVNAESHLVAALAAANDSWIESRRAALDEALAAIRLRLGSLELRGGIEGAQVMLDGVVVAAVPVPAPIRAPVGTFRLEVTAPGYYPFTRMVTIVAEGTTRETIEMTATPREGTSTRIDRDAGDAGRARRRSHALGFSLLGVGVGSLGASVATFVVRENAAQHWNSMACLADGRTREENCRPDRVRVRRAERASVATLSVGGAFVASGIILLLVRPSSEDGEQARVSCEGTVGVASR